MLFCELIFLAKIKNIVSESNQKHPKNELYVYYLFQTFFSFQTFRIYCTKTYNTYIILKYKTRTNARLIVEKLERS